MSDELFEKDELEDEDVEAHRRAAARSDEPEGGEDVEAHRRLAMANDDDDSDDVEAHRRQA